MHIARRSYATLIAVTSLAFALFAGNLHAGPTRHKVEVADPADEQLVVAGGGRLLADYGSYRLYEIEQIPATHARRRGPENRDAYNHIRFNAADLDTTLPDIRAQRRPLAAFAGKRMHVIQFVGPVQPAWYESLLKTGCAIVDYVPHNSYIVYGDAAALARLQSWAALANYVQWEGAYQPAHRVHPHARTTDALGNPRTIGTDTFTIQLLDDEAANAGTLALIDRLKLDATRKESRIAHFRNIRVKLNPASLDEIAGQPDVISIQPYFVPHKMDERQDQIVAGNLSGNSPSGPGYLAWLASKGFTQAQFDASGFVVDLTDSGVDNGTQSPNHFGLYVTGTRPGTSRIVYNRLEGSANSGSTIQGCDGHGNINSHIIGGYVDLAGSPHVDASGYHYGLGVCPFVKIGSSVIFDPSTFTDPNYTNMLSRAYRDGARLSSNSWGADTFGAYDADSQAYDFLVRDSQPANAAVPNSGNQEMVIVFAAGNAGSSANTVGSPGTAKNVITVGAAENVHPFGGSDACATTDTQANSANDIVNFSSRGPCDDGRKKPEIVAPGTHITGGVAQTSNPGTLGTANACFDGSGVCGGTGGNNFFPAGQEFYTASSGTSHSTPAVAGGCALLRQYFINQGWNAPSPAMTKAYLMNSARYMTGTSANDTLWSNNQGLGMMNLGVAFDGVARVLRDQVGADRFTASGQTRTFVGSITDTSKPFRVTLAWTDAPGSTSSAAYKNNLDLTVTVAGNTYKGNVFSGQYSTTGGTADSVDNAECIVLAAGVSGTFTATVTAVNINSDGVPNNADALDQDFALVLYNASATVLPPVALTVNKTGAGAGTITSSPAGIDCGATCAATFDTNSIVTLTAVAGANCVFTGWSGDATGTSNAVAVTMNVARSVTGTFREHSFITGVTVSPATPAFSDTALAVTDILVSSPDLGITSYAYQWQFTGDGLAYSNEPGATSVTLPLSPSLAGKLWRCRVAPVDVYGTGTNFFSAGISVINRPSQLGAHNQPYSFQTALYVPAGTSGAGTFTRNAIINEFSQGASGSKEWVEILFLKTSDARGWTLIDGNGSGTITFSGSAVWSNVAAGTLAVIYNAVDRDTALPADDTDPSDGTLVISTNNTALLTGAWIGLGNGGDAVVLRDSGATLIDGISYGSNSSQTPQLGAVGANTAAAYTNNTEAGVDVLSNWQTITSSSATPAAANSLANSNLIAGLRAGTTATPLYALGAGSDVVPGLSIDVTNGLFAGTLNVSTGGFFNVALERTSGANTNSQQYTLLVGDANGLYTIPAGKSWLLNNDYTIPGSLTVLGTLDTAGHTLIVSNTLDVTAGTILNATGLIKYGTLLGGPLPGSSEALGSNPQVLSIQINGADVVIIYNATGGQRYELQNRLSYDAGDWSAIATNNPSVTGPDQFTHPGGANQPQQLYRIRLLP